MDNAIGAAPAARIAGADGDASAGGEEGLPAWNRSDLELIPDIFDDPEVETHIARAPIDSDPVYYGPEGHCRAMEVWNDAWREWGGDIEDVIDEGRDQVLIIARVYGEGAASGIRLDGWGAVRYTFSDGRILRVEGAFDPDRHRALDALDALEAVGLRE
jgi:hypothetical protein